MAESMELEKLQEECAKLEAQKNEIDEAVDELEEKEETLLQVVKEEQKAIEQTEEAIEALQRALYELEQVLDSHTDEIENITEQLRIKREICSELENQIIEKEVVIDELSKAEFCKRALTMDETNSCCSYLYSTSSTIPIITRYRQSGKEFLKLNAGLYVGKVTGFSYVIVNANIRIKESKKYVSTMTELKKESCKHLCLVTTERMQKLKDHILSAVRDYDELSSGLIIPLSEPCLIGGQAEINKTGYGWEYRGSHCYEGTNYGEMTGLYVIGIQIQ